MRNEESIMAITTTKVEFTNASEVATLTGNVAAATVKSQFVSIYPFLENCTFTEKVEGSVKTITFSEQTGTKGC
jgi:hypothetical protein